MKAVVKIAYQPECRPFELPRYSIVLCMNKKDEAMIDYFEMENHPISSGTD